MRLHSVIMSQINYLLTSKYNRARCELLMAKTAIKLCYIWLGDRKLDNMIPNWHGL